MWNLTMKKDSNLKCHYPQKLVTIESPLLKKFSQNEFQGMKLQRILSLLNKRLMKIKQRKNQRFNN